MTPGSLQHRRSSTIRTGKAGASALALVLALGGLAAPAFAQEASSPAPGPDPEPSAAAAYDDSGSKTGIFSPEAFTVLLDARLVVANGATSFANGGFGKTRFQGDADGGFKARVVPVELSLIHI